FIQNLKVIGDGDGVSAHIIKSVYKVPYYVALNQILYTLLSLLIFHLIHPQDSLDNGTVIVAKHYQQVTSTEECQQDFSDTIELKSAAYLAVKLPVFATVLAILNPSSKLELVGVICTLPLYNLAYVVLEPALKPVMVQSVFVVTKFANDVFDPSANSNYQSVPLGILQPAAVISFQNVFSPRMVYVLSISTNVLFFYGAISLSTMDKSVITLPYPYTLPIEFNSIFEISGCT
ncbi:MAG: hypothetical protein EZS28_047947, partial [Streblomastix strix]